MSRRQRDRRWKRRTEAEARNRSRSRLLAGAGLTFGLPLGLVPAAQGAVVANNGDTGPGSLRQAVLDTNTSAPDDTITFQAGVTGSITLTTGELTVTDALTIDGPGANVLLVSGNDNSRHFVLDPATAGDDVQIEGLTLANGKVTGSGGSISNVDADLKVRASVLTGNDALGPTNDGGAISSPTSYPDIEYSTLSLNTAADDGGAISAYGPALENSTVFNNTAGDDGGAMSGFVPQSYDSTISGNQALGGGGAGGGIYVDPAGGDEGYIYSSIVANNVASAGSDLSGDATVGDTLLESNNVNGGALNDAGNNIFSMDPQLGPLGSNGGTTPTMKPAASSPAIDKGDGFFSNDQRGSPRSVDAPGIPGTISGDDMGAVELTLAELGVAPPPPSGGGGGTTVAAPATAATAAPPAGKKCKKKKRHALAAKKKCKKK